MRRSFLSIASSLLVIVIAVTVVLVKRSLENRGKKVYLDTVVETEKYTLSFERYYETIDDKAHCSIYILITNNLEEDQKFTFKNAFFKKASGTKVTFKKLNDNGFTLTPHESDYYFFGCPINSNSDATGLKLHFGLNGDYYNLYITNSTTTN